MSLLIAFRAEILKTRKTVAFYCTLIAAAFIPVIYALNIFTHGLPDEDQSVKDPLNSIFNGSGVINTIAIFPLFVVVLCTLLAQIEYRNQAWKQVLSAPHTKANIFLSKFLTVQLMMVLFIVATHAFMWLVAVTAHYKLPGLHILDRPFDAGRIYQGLLNMYVSTLALCAIQFWISIRFKNFIIGIAVGLALWLVGTLLALEMKSPMAGYFPYSFPSMSVKLDSSAFNLRSLGSAFVILLVGFLEFRRSEKG
ncbi:MAG: hypothetical protein EOO09_08005 [Chitinophagaceae bacterium]|nr:MAG: hypothetical protein EOO09_08005 [Chitinophagaceae bacterium]